MEQVVIEDKAKVDIVMDGKKIHGRKQAVEFREELFKEHFGLSKEEQGDIVSDRFWKVWPIRPGKTPKFTKKSSTATPITKLARQKTSGASWRGNQRIKKS